MWHRARMADVLADRLGLIKQASSAALPGVAGHSPRRSPCDMSHESRRCSRAGVALRDEVGLQVAVQSLQRGQGGQTGGFGA